MIKVMGNVPVVHKRCRLLCEVVDLICMKKSYCVNLGIHFL